jgi:hypothetical protein
MNGASWLVYLNLLLLDQARGCTCTGRFYKRLNPTYGTGTQRLCESCLELPVYTPIRYEPVTSLQFCGLQARPTVSEFLGKWLKWDLLKVPTV